MTSQINNSLCIDIIICPKTFKIERFNYKHNSLCLIVGNRMCGDILNGGIRLVGGSSEHEGRVEICLDGEWGTICNNFWSYQEARVVCRQLSFRQADAIAIHTTRYGKGTGPIHLDRFVCFGDEDQLIDCGHGPISNECTHGQDSGVMCSGN